MNFVFRSLSVLALVIASNAPLLLQAAPSAPEEKVHRMRFVNYAHRTSVQAFPSVKPVRWDKMHPRTAPAVTAPPSAKEPVAFGVSIDL